LELFGEFILTYVRLRDPAEKEIAHSTEAAEFAEKKRPNPHEPYFVRLRASGGAPASSFGM
jgi:hypothetical protein